MKKYQVTLYPVFNATMEVEAESEDDAITIAKNDFDPRDVDFQFDYTELH